MFLNKHQIRITDIGMKDNINQVIQSLGKAETEMSEAILVRNKNYSIISSDSLMHNLVYDSQTGQWKSQKAFYQPKVYCNKEKKMIWAITGVDIYKDICEYINLLHVNDIYLLEKELTCLQQILSYYLQSHEWIDGFLESKIIISFCIQEHLYSCLIIASSNPSSIYNQCSFLNEEPSRLAIESYADLDFYEKVTNEMSKEELCDISIQHIQNVMKQDKESSRFSYPIVGGDIYTLSLDNKGNIQYYINGQETCFKK